MQLEPRDLYEKLEFAKIIERTSLATAIPMLLSEKFYHTVF